MKHVVLVASLLGLSLSAQARTNYPQEIPNGAAFRCLTCHSRSGGGEGWNDFGKEILVLGDANPDANPADQNLGFDVAFGTPNDYWFDLCALDSDGDGATNAEELGDLDCDSVADEGLVASNPGDINSTPEAPAEGEGEGETGGCAATPPESPASLLAVVGLAALLRRRKNRSPS